MKTIKIGNGSIAYEADRANTLYTMAQGKAIISQDFGLDILGTATNRDFVIDGIVDADQIAVRIGLSDAPVSDVDFTLGKTARIISDAAGIVSYGQDVVIRNAGSIVADADGIRTFGDQAIVNSGDISGINGLNLYYVGGDVPTVRNSGSISGTNYSIYGSGGNDRIVNSGELHGDVQLGGGADIFIHKAGSIEGVVRGGIGDDVFVTSRVGLSIVEGVGEGEDTVRASVDFVLQANVEDLYLTGKADIDGTGNGSDNELYGNAGRNQLSAGYGFDILDGGAGNDLLEGGVGADQFRFRRDTGRDVVTDYEATFDDIYFVELKGATTFADMIADHAEEKAGNVVITYGKDAIVIRDHAIADLQEADFHFDV